MHIKKLLDNGRKKVNQLHKVINPRRMRRRVTVVVWSVRVCVTTNLGIHAESRQVMGTSGISGVWQSFKKRRFL